MTERMFFNPTLKLSKNKYLELQSGTWKYWSYFDFCFRWNRRTDHAGLYFMIELFGLYFTFDVYDSRHWSIEDDCWECYEPISKEQSHCVRDSIDLHCFGDSIDEGNPKIISPGCFGDSVDDGMPKSVSSGISIRESDKTQLNKK